MFTDGPIASITSHQARTGERKKSVAELEKSKVGFFCRGVDVLNVGTRGPLCFVKSRKGLIYML